MKRVFAYLRVSSKGQLEGDGFDRQRAKVQAFCDARGWTVVRWFEEALTGTSDYDDRVAFVEMLSLLGPGTAETVVVEKADRLARDLMVSELAIQEIAKAGGTVFSAEAEVNLTDDSDPTRVLIRQLLGALAQWDKSNLVARLRAARERKAARGERAVGVERWEDRCAFHQTILAELYRLHEQGHSYMQLARVLNKKRVPSPTGHKHWSKSTVYDVVCRYEPRNTNLEELTPEQREAILELEKETNAQD